MCRCTGLKRKRLISKATVSQIQLIIIFIVNKPVSYSSINDLVVKRLENRENIPAFCLSDVCKYIFIFIYSIHNDR